MPGKYWLALFLAFVVTQPAMGAETIYAKSDVEARRFSDSETPTVGDVKADARLTVVYRLEDWVRVRVPDNQKFGWIPVSATTTEVPEGVTPESSNPLDSLDPEQREALQKMLNQAGRSSGP